MLEYGRGDSENNGEGSRSDLLENELLAIFRVKKFLNINNEEAGISASIGCVMLPRGNNVDTAAQRHQTLGKAR